jgi:predicted nuclease of predicted toxin-antitoxin system
VKLLIDSCLSRTVAVALAEAGHDVESVRDWGPDPGDPQILRGAAARGRVLVTTDRGIGRLAIEERLKGAGVVIIRQTPARDHTATVQRAIEQHEAELLAGAIVIIAPDRIRARWPQEDA